MKKYLFFFHAHASLMMCLLFAASLHALALSYWHMRLNRYPAHSRPYIRDNTSELLQFSVQSSSPLRLETLPIPKPRLLPPPRIASRPSNDRDTNTLLKSLGSNSSDPVSSRKVNTMSKVFVRGNRSKTKTSTLQSEKHSPHIDPFDELFLATDQLLKYVDSQKIPLNQRNSTVQNPLLSPTSISNAPSSSANVDPQLEAYTLTLWQLGQPQNFSLQDKTRALKIDQAFEFRKISLDNETLNLWKSHHQEIVHIRNRVFLFWVTDRNLWIFQSRL